MAKAGPVKFHHTYGSDIIEQKPEEMQPKAPIIGDDPLNSFDRYHWKEQTDLGAWMTYSPEVREAKCRKYAANKANMDRRHKNLVYIIFVESAHKNGSPKIVAMASDFLTLTMTANAS